MAETVAIDEELFLDAAFAIALSAPADQYHARAIELADELENSSTRLVTTEAVLLEIGNALSKQRYRRAAVQMLRSLYTDPGVEIVAVANSLVLRGLAMFSRHADKEWGMTDCISFAVMRERGIRAALTSDRHFEQAGFEILLT